MKKIFIIAILAIGVVMACTKGSSDVGVSVDGNGSGQGGSMAKFSISGDYLFLINDWQLKTYDISNEALPQFVSDLNVDMGIETVFTLGDHLFIGSVNGMYIYDISNPNNIKYLSYYQHITSCDPVVANDSLAFVTLNSSSSCWWNGGANRLDVLDISNKINPTLLTSKNLYSPKGLGIKDNYVFVCNSDQGVGIFDYSNPYNLTNVGSISGIDSYDLIIDGNHLFLIGKDGLFQYDISNVFDINLISNILFQ